MVVPQTLLHVVKTQDHVLVGAFTTEDQARAYIAERPSLSKSTVELVWLHGVPPTWVTVIRLVDEPLYLVSYSCVHRTSVSGAKSSAQLTKYPRQAKFYKSIAEAEAYRATFCELDRDRFYAVEICVELS